MPSASRWGSSGRRTGGRASDARPHPPRRDLPLGRGSPLRRVPLLRAPFRLRPHRAGLGEMKIEIGNEKNIGKMVGDLVNSLLSLGARRVTKYLSPKMVVSAARPVYKEAPWSARDTRVYIVIKIGAPNFAERAFIKKCQNAS